MIMKTSSTNATDGAYAKASEILGLKHNIARSLEMADRELTVEVSFKLDNGGGVEMLYPEQFVARSQDLEIVYHDAGKFYWGTIEAWMDQRPFFTQNSTMFKIPKYRVVDIDNLDDWKRAEMIFQYLKG